MDVSTRLVYKLLPNVVEKMFKKHTIFFWGGAHLWHMEGPRLGGQLEAYATTTTTRDRSCIIAYSNTGSLTQLSEVRD